MSADAKLKAYIDRILRCREAEDAAKDDTKAVYAELAGDGYEKAIVGQVVTFLRKREKDGDKLSEQSAKFDLYLEAYERPSHAHTRVKASNHGESNERDQHVGRTHDEQHDEAPVSGSDGRGESADAGAEGQGAGASGSDRAGGAVAGTVDREDQDGGSRHVGGEARHEVIEASDGSPSVSSSLTTREAEESVVPHSPETANELQHPVPHATGANARSGGDGSTVRGARTEADAVTAGETAPHSDQPLKGGDEDPRAVGELTSKTGEGAASALPIKPKYHLRPNCLDRSNCKSGSVDHCWSCKKAMAEKSEVAA